MVIEIYLPDRFEGRWVVVEGSSAGIDNEYIANCVRSLRNDDRYKDATLEFLQDGDDCIIGVFCGREPPAEPKTGIRLPPEMFGVTHAPPTS
jgi:hypothetical protein